MIRYLILALMASLISKANAKTTDFKEELCRDMFYKSKTETDNCENNFSDEQVNLMELVLDDIIDDGNWHDFFEDEANIQGLKLILDVGPTPLTRAFNRYTITEAKDFLNWIMILSVELTSLDDDVLNNYYHADYKDKKELLEQIENFKTEHPTLIRDIKNLAGNLEEKTQSMEQRMAISHGIKHYAGIRYTPTASWRVWEEEKEEWIILDLVNKTNADWWDYREKNNCSNIGTRCIGALDVVSSLEVGHRTSKEMEQDPGYQFFWCRQKPFMNSVARCLEGLNFVSSAGQNVLPF